MFQLKSTLVLNEQLNEGCWRMVLDASRLASEVKPGQFIMVKINRTNDPLFRRPFSVFRRVPLSQGGIGIEVVYKVAGRGTQSMTQLTPGDELDIIGPLGRGFERVHDKRTHILVGGGTGSASLFMIGEELSRGAKEDGLDLIICLGTETKRSLVLEKEFKALKGKVMVSTDDGTYGYHGT